MVTYEEREQLDSYKAKDYAQNYDKSTASTSRDQESYARNTYSSGGQDFGGVGFERRK